MVNDSAKRPPPLLVTAQFIYLANQLYLPAHKLYALSLVDKPAYALLQSNLGGFCFTDAVSKTEKL